jgi:hypothetical protein
MDMIVRYFCSIIQGMDPPAHTRQRALMTKAFTPRILERIRGQIQQLTEDLVGPWQKTGQIELVHALAHPLPITVILQLLGIPAEIAGHVSASSAAISEFFSLIVPAPGQLMRLAETLRTSSEQLRPIIHERRMSPQNDLLSSMATAEDNGEMLSEDEVGMLAALMLFAGHETTTHMIGNIMLALLRNPDEMERLKADPSLLEPAIPELLRYDTSVQFVWRVALEDLQLRDKTVRRGERVMLGLGAANRDPSVFRDPDHLDVKRPAPRPLTLGHGIHYCLGAALAKMECESALRSLLRLPGLRLATDRVEWRPNFVLRGPASLPLAFEPTAE